MYTKTSNKNTTIKFESESLSGCRICFLPFLQNLLENRTPVKQGFLILCDIFSTSKGGKGSFSISIPRWLGTASISRRSPKPTENSSEMPCISSSISCNFSLPCLRWSKSPIPKDQSGDKSHPHQKLQNKIKHQKKMSWLHKPLKQVSPPYPKWERDICWPSHTGIVWWAFSACNTEPHPALLPLVSRASPVHNINKINTILKFTACMMHSCWLSIYIDEFGGARAPIIQAVNLKSRKILFTIVGLITLVSVWYVCLSNSYSIRMPFAKYIDCELWKHCLNQETLTTLVQPFPPPSTIHNPSWLFSSPSSAVSTLCSTRDGPDWYHSHGPERSTC